MMFGMSWPGSKIELALEIIFLAVLLAVSFHTFVTSDFWFHLKTGEYIFQNHGLPFVDYFSHTVSGQPIIPYEWLDELLVYLIYSNFGSFGIGLYALFFLFLFVLFFRQILTEIFNLNLLGRTFLIAVTILLTNPYWSERPQIIAYTCFIITLYISLKRVFQGRNLLWLTIPIFFVWTNLHASMILGLVLLGSYAFLSFVKYYKYKQKNDLALTKDFATYLAINSVITILAPLGFGVYQLLWKFYLNKELISSFIDEWSGLTVDMGLAVVYGLIYILVTASFLWVIFRKKRQSVGERRELLFQFLPLLPVAAFALTGERQSPFSFPALFLFLVPLFKSLSFKLPKLLTLGITVIIMTACCLTLNMFITTNTNNYKVSDQYYPNQIALKFIKTNLKGNMLNDFGLGGYLLNFLGPEQKVFIDGRTEMYLPSIMKDAKGFADNKYLSESDLLTYFDGVVAKYDISWVWISSENYTVWRKIMHILFNQPSWHLVYFDDSGELFVKDDGKNDQTIKKYNMDVISPFQKTVYQSGKDQQAFNQFTQMEEISPSSVAANSIGYILYAQKKPEEAKKYFIDAINFNPLSQTSVSARSNLAEVYVLEGNLQAAVALYQQVLNQDSQRGNAYLRLGQLILQSGGSKEDANNVWQTGIKNITFDDGIIQKLQDQINSNQ